MNENEKIWEKQSYETNLQYRYFHQYLMLNYEIKQNNQGTETLTTSVSTKRSIRNLAKKVKKNYSNLAKMSCKNDWQKRAEAFDLYMLNEIKSRREREYLEAQDRYSEIGREIFEGIKKSLTSIDWQKLKPTDMEKLIKVAHAFELGEETTNLQNYINTENESSTKELDSDSKARIEKIYTDCLKNPPAPKKMRKIKKVENNEE